MYVNISFEPLRKQILRYARSPNSKPPSAVRRPAQISAAVSISGSKHQVCEDGIRWNCLFLPSRHEPLAITWPSAKIHHQISLKMQSSFLYYRPQSSFLYCRPIKCATARRNHYQAFSSDDGFDQNPFWWTMIQDIAQILRSLALFLLEQPSQLKYIEWPSLESTVKTATLTLVLVALLIVSLASVDSFLSYILALLVRKTA